MKTSKFTLFLILLFLNSNYINSSTTDKNSKSNTIKVLYKVSKSVKKGKEVIVLKDTMELIISGNKSVYESWNKMLHDSLLKKVHKDINFSGKKKVHMYNLDMFKNAIGSQTDYANWNGDYVTETIYKDKKNHTAVYLDFIKKEWKKSERVITPPQWEINSDTLTILGYSCTKATTSFKGRKYYAWFCFNLPINDGPWLFYGLPGLILKVEDVDNLFSFEAIGIEKLKNNIDLNVPKKEPVRIVKYKHYKEYQMQNNKYLQYFTNQNDKVYFCDVENPIVEIPIEIETKNKK